MNGGLMDAIGANKLLAAFLTTFLASSKIYFVAGSDLSSALEIVRTSDFKTLAVGVVLANLPAIGLVVLLASLWYVSSQAYTGNLDTRGLIVTVPMVLISAAIIPANSLGHLPDGADEILSSLTLCTLALAASSWGLGRFALYHAESKGQESNAAKDQHTTTNVLSTATREALSQTKPVDMPTDSELRATFRRALSAVEFQASGETIPKSPERHTLLQVLSTAQQEDDRTLAGAPLAGHLRGKLLKLSGAVNTYIDNAGPDESSIVDHLKLDRQSTLYPAEMTLSRAATSVELGKLISFRGYLNYATLAGAAAVAFWTMTDSTFWLTPQAIEYQVNSGDKQTVVGYVLDREAGSILLEDGRYVLNVPVNSWSATPCSLPSRWSDDETVLQTIAGWLPGDATTQAEPQRCPDN